MFGRREEPERGGRKVFDIGKRYTKFRFMKFNNKPQAVVL
jgi:hypothetical protein